MDVSCITWFQVAVNHRGITQHSQRVQQLAQKCLGSGQQAHGSKLKSSRNSAMHGTVLTPCTSCLPTRGSHTPLPPTPYLH